MKKRFSSLFIFIFLFGFIYFIQGSINKEIKSAKIGQPPVIVAGRFIGPSILGFKDVVADMLWVLANQLFWEEEYLKVVPLFRTITLIDPHYIVVYSVGAWHFAWNLGPLLDEPEEEWKRWVPAGIEFLEEGIKNNPNRYDLYFELGWLYFQKLKDYTRAAEYFESAIKFEHPGYIDHMLAHSYDRADSPGLAAKKWEEIISRNPENKVAVANYEKLRKKINRNR